jgi:hypothetical protein
VSNNKTYHSFFQRIIAFFVLAVFAFSITPKIALHDFVANHKDTPIKSNAQKQAQLHNAGFNCNADNLVVESPFTDPQEPDLTSLSGSPSPKNAENFLVIIGRDLYLAHLRGPPVFPAVRFAFMA